jgi:SAM-dependent methyltransferase
MPGVGFYYEFLSTMQTVAQSPAVKRAQIEFHNFASLGEPERALLIYAEENERRAAFLRNHLAYAGSLSPFLEIGANVGHSAYMLVNEFGAEGFASDLSADSLRHGTALMEAWNLERAPIRLAADALQLPFADDSLQCVVAFQMLSQFLDLDSVFREVQRVLRPGGVFLFAEEPVRRRITLGLYRCPYPDTMKPWERRLHQWGLLGYLVRDVIGAHQEESFGIRQNHTMVLEDWRDLVDRHFAGWEYELYIPERGWGERWGKRLFGAGLGGTLAAVCKKAGTAEADGRSPRERLRCPDCLQPLSVAGNEVIRCRCGYTSPLEGGVYNLLPTKEKEAFYPGDRADIIDFSREDHEERLGSGWYEREGVFGNKFRWIGERASATLANLRGGPQRLRIRGHAHSNSFVGGAAPWVRVRVNGIHEQQWTLGRTGLFILETDLPPASTYEVEIAAGPTWTVPTDDRTFTVNLSMIRLDPLD